jgi:hypothetical protein
MWVAVLGTDVAVDHRCLQGLEDRIRSARDHGDIGCSLRLTGVVEFGSPKAATDIRESR